MYGQPETSRKKGFAINIRLNGKTSYQATLSTQYILLVIPES